jgi:4-hydroxy-2-oxoglutarate aldolase
MSPHNDAPSPPGSYTYTTRFNNMTLNNSTIHPTPFLDHELSSDSEDELSQHRPLVPGFYVPTVAFFDKITEDLDVNTIGKHAVRLAQAGVAGITTQGSNGEAVHLTQAERKTVTEATRLALNDAGFTEMPIIVGCGAQSTREAIEFCKDAFKAGGDYALCLPPAYYRPLFKSSTVIEFFNDVADASPIPIMIYNYPGAVAGMDLSSDDIIKLSKHRNIVGCKLTCGNTGKLNRVAAATNASTPTEHGSGFMCLGGSADFTLQAMVGGGSGIIGGLANIAPKACVKICTMATSGKLTEARRLQAIVARGDWAAIQTGIVGTKSAMETYLGYGGVCRKPLPSPTKEESIKYAQDFAELMALENSL